MDNQICKIHNEPAVYCESGEQKNLVLQCRFCMQLKLNIQNIDDEEKQGLKFLEMKFDQCIKQLKDFTEILEQFTQQIQQNLKLFKLSVEKSISYFIDNKNQVKNISNDFTYLQLNIIKEHKRIINNQLERTLFELNNHIKEIENIKKQEQLYQSIEEIYKLIQLDDIKEIPQIDKVFDYQLMQQSTYKQNERCFAIVFNSDATIMIAGCEKFIKLFEFQNDKLRELQQLSGHSQVVFCLQFMKKSNQFISASQDSTMRIWEFNKNFQCYSNQVLKSHTADVWSIIMNQNEELLISGSNDNTIKFWEKQNNIWSCNQSIDCQSSVFSISLNDQEDKLIASVSDNQIIVITQQNKCWIIIQKISVEQFGYRLCYINQYQFLFQPVHRKDLQIFDFDAKDQTYKKKQELQYINKETGDDCLFPIQQISNIGLIMVKNSHHVHLVKRNWNGQLTLEQSINFNTYLIYGCVTNDGRYIATWDDKSKEIQIRKFEI